MKSQVSIALVEDDFRFRSQLAAQLNQREGWRVVAECGDVASALEDIPKAKPDIILLDIMLPGFKGIDAIPRLKADLPQATIIMLTSVDDPDHIVQALESGADGYVLKGDTAEALIGNLENFLTDGAVMSPTIARRLISLLQKRGTEAGPEDFGLTDRQWQILRLAARGKQIGEIAMEINLAHDTVKNHFRNIYRKLNVSSRAEALYKVNRGQWMDGWMID